MLHATHSDWSASSTGTASSGSVSRFASVGGARGDVITVSSLETGSLVESHPAANDPSTNMVAMSQPSSYRSDSPVVSDASGVDTAVLALGMIGFWLMLLGFAMLSRHFRLVKGPGVGNNRALAR